MAWVLLSPWDAALGTTAGVAEATGLMRDIASGAVTLPDGIYPPDAPPLSIVPLSAVIARWGRWTPLPTPALSEWVGGMVEAQFAGAIFPGDRMTEDMARWSGRARQKLVRVGDRLLPVLWVESGMDTSDPWRYRVIHA